MTSYDVQIDDGADGAFSDSSTGLSATTLQLAISAGLTSGNTYRLKVIGYNDVGSIQSNVVSTVIADAPDQPVNSPYIDSDETTTTQIRVQYDQIADANNGGDSIISYHLQMANSDGSGFFDIIGSESNMTLSTAYTVTGLTRGKTYRFRYRAANSVGWSDYSDVSYLSPSSVPDAPPRPEYVSSTDDQIVLDFYSSEDDGGSGITDYHLEIDDGTATGVYTVVSDYDYSVDGFSYIADRITLSLTSGEKYIFRFQAENARGKSEYSDTLRVGLGPLPSTPTAVTRASEDNTSTSISVEWTELVGETLAINYYILRMDDGNGVTFSEVYTGTLTEAIIEDLTPGVTYTFTVSAVNFNGEGSESTESEF
jgi:hypothetical protein